MKKVPVFLIDGFLEAGKTQFILSTFRRDEFYKRGKTLLLVCEEGEVEYTQEELDKYNVEVEYLLECSDIIRRQVYRKEWELLKFN